MDKGAGIMSDDDELLARSRANYERMSEALEELRTLHKIKALNKETEALIEQFYD
jgi:hypothetical protein